METDIEIFCFLIDLWLSNVALEFIHILICKFHRILTARVLIKKSCEILFFWGKVYLISLVRRRNSRSLLHMSLTATKLTQMLTIIVRTVSELIMLIRI